jgi:hypothetical protein
MAGRFVAQLPLPRLSFASAAAFRPRYWGWTQAAPLATVRATFFGTSAVYDAAGCAAAQVGEGQLEGVAAAEAAPAGAARARLPAAQVPWELRAFEALMRPMARGEYARNRKRAYQA